MTGLTSTLHALARFIRTGDTAVERYVVSSARATATTRLGIYAEAYRLRLREALVVDYPGVAGMLGQDAFAELALAYIDAHPSQHYSLRYFGTQLGQFLRTDRRYAGRPWLAELARFEWALRTAFDAADCETLTLNDVGAIPTDAWSAMRFVWQPAMQRLDLQWNVTQLWQGVYDGIDLPTPQAQSQAVPWLIWRHDLRVFFRSLAPAEALAIDATLQGADFAGVCEALCDQLPQADVPERAAGYLRVWVEAGLVRQIGLGMYGSEIASDVTAAPI